MPRTPPAPARPPRRQRPLPRLCRRAAAGVLVPLLGGACAPGATPAAQAGTPAGEPAADAAPVPEPAAGEWQVLFDGTSLDAWRGYRRADLPAAWRIEDGALAFRPVEDAAARGDLVTREQFGDFELELEWKVGPGANSGVMVRVAESGGAPWETGVEMQVLDDERHPDAATPSHRAGALYDLVVPPAGITRPVGEWNAARIVARGPRLQMWLNGRQTADVEVGSPEWGRLLAASKFAATAGFAGETRGHVALQDHGDPVWFRNIRIRRLEGTP